MTYSLFGWQTQVEYCEKCVISNQRPASTVEMMSDGTRKTWNQYYRRNLRRMPI